MSHPNSKRPAVIASMPAEAVVALREYFNNCKEGRPQTDETRAAMAMYRRLLRRLYPDAAERGRELQRRYRAERTPEQVEAERLRHNAASREKYRQSKGGVVRPYNRR